MKKAISLVLACLMLVGCLAGCGGDKPESSLPENENSSVSTDPGMEDTTTTDDGVNVEDTTEAVDSTTAEADNSTTMEADDSTTTEEKDSTTVKKPTKTTKKTTAKSTKKTTKKTTEKTTKKTTKKTTEKTTEKTTSKTTASANWSIETAPMPTADLSNKTLSYYHWIKIDNAYESGIPVDELFADEFGVKYKETIGTHENYWDTLATLKASGNAPDMVFMPNWNFYPSPISNDLLEPLDDLIDFSDPLWKDTEDQRKAFMWDGKTYLVFPEVAKANSWMFYNTQVFKNKGEKTPREYYEAGEWTWDTMVEVANKFLQKKSNGTISFYGVGFKENHFVASTGVELVEKQGTKGVLNLKDEKLAKVMNHLYDLGQGGSGTLAGSDDVKLFCGGRLAMMAIASHAPISEFHEPLLKKGKLDWVPLPKVDKNSSHFIEIAHNPEWAIVSGAKNKEAAALFIRFNKWCKLGSTAAIQIPVSENAATKKYASQLKDTKSPWCLSDLFTDEQQAWTAKLVNENKTCSNVWFSWLGDKQLQGYNYIWSGTKKWSAVVEEIFPLYKSILESY